MKLINGNYIPQVMPKIVYQRTANRNGFLRSATGQCDACSPAIKATTGGGIPSQTTVYKLHPDLRLFQIDTEHWAALHPTAHGPAVLNNGAIALLKQFESPRSICDFDCGAVGADGVASALDDLIALSFLVPLGLRPDSLVEAQETLSAWLHVTNACNLKCSYCYLDKTKHSMNLETGRKAIDAIFWSAITHQYKNVQVKFAGGEPTLAFPLVLHLHQYAQELSIRHGLCLDSRVISNGTRLNRNMLEQVKRYGLQLTISMDGLESFHDNQRSFVDGQGSACYVERVVDDAIEYGFVPSVSVTVSGRNLAGLPALVEWLLARNVSFGLNYYRQNDVSAVYADLLLDEQRVVETMQSVFHVIEANLPDRSLLASLVDLTDLSVPRLHTCSVGHSYLVIDHYGSIAKCQMDIGRQLTTIANEDPLSIIRSDQTSVQSIPVTSKEGCRDCEWRYWCTGGCPLLTYRVTGRYDVKSPNCGIYRAVYPGVVKIEALRLLKYATETTHRSQLGM